MAGPRLSTLARRTSTGPAHEHPAHAMTARPTPEQLRLAASRTVPDIIAPGLRVLFCGINPGLYSAFMRQHFARPGNRFWPTLHAAGFTPTLLQPSQQRELLDLGLGITNIVARASAAADELTPAELEAGARRLAAKVRRHAPRVLAVLGLDAYRRAFGAPRAGVGAQPHAIASTTVWVLPNPSGLNAAYRAADLARLYGELRRFVAQDDSTLRRA
jgi:TDG/mug DNA glycosylase family protein